MTLNPQVVLHADSRKKRLWSASFAFLGLLLSLTRPAPAQVIESFSIDSEATRFVYQIFEQANTDGNPRTWVATSSGLLRQQDSFLDLWKQGVKVHRIAAFDDRLWFATANGLRSQDWTPVASTGRPNPEPGAPFTTLVATEQALWAGGHGRLVYLLRDGTQRSIGVAGTVNAIVPVGSVLGQPSHLWVSTTSGIYRVDLPGDLQLTQVADEDPHPVIQHPRLQLIDLAATADRIWFVESYEGPRGGQTFMRLHEIPVSTPLGPKTSVQDRLLTVDRIDSDELWVCREESDGSIAVLAGRIDPAGDDLRFARIDVPFEKLRIGKPKRLLADSTRRGGLWIWSTAGLFRGLEHDASSWAKVAIPGLNLATAQFVQEGLGGTLWLNYPADGLLRLQPDAQLAFRLGYEHLTIFPAWDFSLQWLGFNKTGLLAPRSSLQITDCRYEGAIGPLSEIKEETCRGFKKTVADNREQRDEALESWRVGKNLSGIGGAAPLPTSMPTAKVSTILKPLPNFLPPAFAGVADKDGNQSSVDFVIIYLGWQFLLSVGLIFLVIAPWARGFVFSVLEVIFGTRIGIVALRTQHFRRLYLRRYVRGALESIRFESMASGTSPTWKIFDGLAPALRNGRWFLQPVPPNVVDYQPELFEKWALDLTLKKDRHRLLSGLLPMRVDVAFEDDFERGIVKRLKCLGGMEKRIAEFIWEHADFLFILYSSSGWQEGTAEEETAIDRLLNFVRLQSEDAEARFAIIAGTDEVEFLRQELKQRLRRKVKLLPPAEIEARDQDEKKAEEGERNPSGGVNSAAQD